MTEAAELKPTDKVLEVGTGSGYAAAIASRLAKTVHTIERHGALARIAAQRLSALGCANCIVHTGDGTRGLAVTSSTLASFVGKNSGKRRR
jgi:protein-L-isoaspartate O-methyltransferase